MPQQGVGQDIPPIWCSLSRCLCQGGYVAIQRPSSLVGAQTETAMIPCGLRAVVREVQGVQVVRCRWTDLVDLATMWFHREAAATVSPQAPTTGGLQ